MKKLLFFSLFVLSSSLAFAGSCSDKECTKDKKEGKTGAIVEISTFAGSCGSCGGCSGDKKDEKEKKETTEESGFSIDYPALA